MRRRHEREVADRTLVGIGIAATRRSKDTTAAQRAGTCNRESPPRPASRRSWSPDTGGDARVAHCGAGSFLSVGKPISTKGCLSENFAASFAVSGRRRDALGQDAVEVASIQWRGSYTKHVGPDRSATLRTPHGSAARVSHV